MYFFHLIKDITKLVQSLLHSVASPSHHSSRQVTSREQPSYFKPLIFRRSVSSPYRLFLDRLARKLRALTRRKLHDCYTQARSTYLQAIALQLCKQTIKHRPHIVLTVMTELTLLFITEIAILAVMFNMNNLVMITSQSEILYI